MAKSEYYTLRSAILEHKILIHKPVLIVDCMGVKLNLSH
jgi:hypothetical protein